jgi:hypothetical protein
LLENNILVYPIGSVFNCTVLYYLLGLISMSLIIVVVVVVVVVVIIISFLNSLFI